MDFFGHFDKWNNLEKIFFFIFFIIHRGDPYDFGHNHKGPPYEFWKNEKKIFFLDYSRYQNGQKNPLQKTSLKVSNTLGTPQKRALLFAKFASMNWQKVEPYFGHFQWSKVSFKMVFKNDLVGHFVIWNSFLKRRR